MPQLRVALVEFPERLGFDLRLYGGDVTLLPGLEAFLRAVLRDFVLGPYVLPGRLVVDLTSPSPEEEALGFDRPKGLLFVTVEEAARVPRRGVDLLSAADCYVKVGLTGGKKRKKAWRDGGGGGGSAAEEEERREKEEREKRRERHLGQNWSRTRTIPNDDRPRWRQELRPLLVREPANELLNFVLMDADEFGGDDELGRCSVRVSAVVAALEELEREEVERERLRERERRRRRGLARPPEPVSRPEVAEEGESGSAPPVFAPAVAASAAAPAAASSAAAAAAVSSREREEIGGGGEAKGEGGEEAEEDGGFVLVGRATGADADADAAAGASSSSSFVVPPPAAAAAPATPPVTDRSGGGRAAEFFVGVPVDDEETRSALSAAEGANDGGEEVEEDEADGGGGGCASSSSSTVEAFRGSGSVDDPLELWIPCPPLSAASGGPASFISREWRRPLQGGGLSGSRARKAAARGGCLGCLSAAVLPVLSSRGGGGRPAEDHPYEEEGPPLLRVRIAYHAFSDEEIELAGSKGREREASESATHAPAASPIPASLSPSSRAADILGGGILFVRPRRAWNLRAAPLWRRALQAGCGRWRAAWVVRVAVAGGVSEEGGPVTKGGASPRFTEVREREGKEKKTRTLILSVLGFARRSVLIRVEKHFPKKKTRIFSSTVHLLFKFQ